MKRISESDISRIVRKVLKEQEMMDDPCQDVMDELSDFIGRDLPPSCMSYDKESIQDCMREVVNMKPKNMRLDQDVHFLGLVKDFVECRLENRDSVEYDM